MSDPMFSRIAQAITRVERDVLSLEDDRNMVRVDDRTMARYILEAMLEPTERALSDGAFQIFRGQRISPDDVDAARRVWRAMINACLAEAR